MGAYETRCEAVQAELQAESVDIAIFGAGPNLQYLAGPVTDWRRYRDLDNQSTAMMLPADGRPVILSGPFASVEPADRFDCRDLGLFEDPAPAIKEIVDGLADNSERIAVDSFTKRCEADAPTLEVGEEADT